MCVGKLHHKYKPFGQRRDCLRRAVPRSHCGRAVRLVPSSRKVRRIVVILIALVLLGPAVVEASVWFRCGHDDVLRTTCCYPAQARHAAQPSPDTRVIAACCCRITQLAIRASWVRGAPPVAIHGAPAIAVIATPATAPLAAPVRVATSTRACPPRVPPDPLFVRHCSLLL